MLSYLHEFHAGGHADVLKHVVLLAILERLTAKAKPLRYIETHAGAGGYDLRAREAQKNREYAAGIGKLWARDDAPAPVARWLELVRRFNGGDELVRYPGSPWLAREVLRAGDSAYFFELHPRAHEALARRFAGDGRVHVLRQDGLPGGIGLVPPPERRCCMLLDPAYELADEHEQVLDALLKAHRRFATGVYAVWYPVIERAWVRRLERALQATGLRAMDLFELSVAADAHGRGLTGSGMIVVNPPWTLREAMQTVLPWLVDVLRLDGRAAHRVVELAAPMPAPAFPGNR